jgi:hypothetical protein
MFFGQDREPIKKIQELLVAGLRDQKARATLRGYPIGDGQIGVRVQQPLYGLLRRIYYRFFPLQLLPHQHCDQ